MNMTGNVSAKIATMSIYCCFNFIMPLRLSHYGHFKGTLTCIITRNGQKEPNAYFPGSNPVHQRWTDLADHGHHCRGQTQHLPEEVIRLDPSKGQLYQASHHPTSQNLLEFRLRALSSIKK